MMPVAVALWASLSGTYVVPTPERLNDFARFELKNAEWSVARGHLHVRYPSPPELGGRASAPEFIEYRGAFRGDERFVPVLAHPGGYAVGSGHCAVSKDRKALTCLLACPGMSFDRPAVQKFLGEEYSAEEARTRLEVFDLYSNEPRGILTLRQK